MAVVAETVAGTDVAPEVSRAALIFGQPWQMLRRMYISLSIRKDARAYIY